MIETKTLTFRIPPSHYQHIINKAESQGVSQADVLRNLVIDDIRQAHEHSKLDMLERRLSDRIDQITGALRSALNG